MAHICEVQNLVKKYGDFTAVNGISFDIHEGEIFSLLGPNGAGKTTTISVISTLLKPTSGIVTVGGFSVTASPMNIRKMIGVVPQELAIYEDLSARENLEFWGTLYDMHGKQLKNRIDEVLEQIGLTERANDRVKTYSGGMKRRVNIGVGLLHRPQLLFMDEPTVGIDPQSRRAILDSVLALHEQGMTILYTTHYMEEAQELSDRVGIIDHGELIALGTQRALIQQVGEKDTIVLGIVDGQDASALSTALKAVPGIDQVQVTDHAITIMTPEADPLLAPVIDVLNRMGVSVRSVDIEEPNLEAVFLHLTGRALRD